MMHETKAYRTVDGTSEAEQMGIDPPEPEPHPIKFDLRDVVSYCPSPVPGDDETQVTVIVMGEFTIVDFYEDFDAMYTRWREEVPTRDESLAVIASALDDVLYREYV